MGVSDNESSVDSVHELLCLNVVLSDTADEKEIMNRTRTWPGSTLLCLPTISGECLPGQIASLPIHSLTPSTTCQGMKRKWLPRLVPDWSHQFQDLDPASDLPRRLAKCIMYWGAVPKNLQVYPIRDEEASCTCNVCCTSCNKYFLIKQGRHCIVHMDPSISLDMTSTLFDLCGAVLDNHLSEVLISVSWRRNHTKMFNHVQLMVDP